MAVRSDFNQHLLGRKSLNLGSNVAPKLFDKGFFVCLGPRALSKFVIVAPVLFLCFFLIGTGE